MAMFRICGPKMAVFGIVLSVWGIIQLSVMALSFYYNSVAFAEDLPIKECEKQCTFEDMKEKMEIAYGQQAENCGIAVLLYFVTLAISLHQLWMNSDQGRISFCVTRINIFKIKGQHCTLGGGALFLF